MEKEGIRIGHGYDVHAFSANRKLILGGVEIPFDRGLAGHSDADVLLHAVADAILGALALGDIGHFFPDTDPKYKGMDSKVLLREVWMRAKEKKFSLGNLDCTLLAEKPKIAPYMPAMRQTIAHILEGREEQINIKATTMEKLGFVGREEGIVAQAVILLVGE